MDRVLRSVVDALPQPAVVISQDERIVMGNEQAARVLDRSMVGRHFITALRQPGLLDAIEATLRDHQPRSAGYLTRRDGQDMSYAVRCASIERENGRAVLLMFDDTTEVETAGQMRRDFVANVSHELRTPLTAMTGFIETILRGPAREDQAARDRFLGIMESEAARMNRLVGDLLSLSRVEASERVRPTDIISLNGLLQSVCHGLQTLASEAGVTVNLSLPEAEVQVPGDEDQLRQVFTNLVENAIKYGKEGGAVDLRLSAAAMHPRLRTEAVTVTVRDYGPGFDPVHIPRLTERFYRVDTHRSREMGGTGLGLAIVKHIVNRHRGRVQIDSTPGQGAEFRVILPV